MNTPTIDQLHRAIQISEQIAALELEIRAIFQGQAVESIAAPVEVPTTSPEPTKRKRKISAAHRAKLAAAAKARWANAKPAPAAADKPAPKKKGGLTPAGRKKLAAAMKARWAAAKKSGGPAPTAGKK